MPWWIVTLQLSAFQQSFALVPFMLPGLSIAAQQSRIMYGDLVKSPEGNKAAGEREVSQWVK